MSRVIDYFKSLVESQIDLDSAVLRRQTELIGASAAARCVVGEFVKVQGTIRALRNRSQDNFPVVEVELWDGTGYITLLWMGRAKIRGISVGRQLIVQGRISRGPKQQPAIYNPKYELLPNE